MEKPEIVIVDDDVVILDLQQEMLRREGLSAQAFQNPVAAWERIRQGDVRLVITDYEMPEMSGMELLFKAQGLERPPYVILLTGHGTVDLAVQAMSHGAYSFLQKPIDPAPYMRLAKEALQGFRGGETPPSAAREGLPSRAAEAASEPVFLSAAMHEACEVARQAAATDSAILLLGESGTGKEVLADYIHRRSARAKSTLVKVNCGALPEHLMESELFGHEKGAFTGADHRRIGRFELARGGTLLLDEVGDLLPALQVKLLRAIQEKSIERVGSGAPIPVDFRLICATHRDLAAAVKAGTFREDLYYRINVIPITLPPLRERPEDVLPLALHFCKVLRAKLPNRAAEFSPAALEALKHFAWPGNIRQLRNAVEYALVLCRGELIQPKDLPREVQAQGAAGVLPSSVSDAAPEYPGASAAAPTAGLEGRLRQVEADMLTAALQRHNWNIPEVLQELQISRSRFYERLKEYGIKRPGT